MVRSYMRASLAWWCVPVRLNSQSMPAEWAAKYEAAAANGGLREHYVRHFYHQVKF